MGGIPNCKLNVDDTYSEVVGNGGANMVLRDNPQKKKWSLGTALDTSFYPPVANFSRPSMQGMDCPRGWMELAAFHLGNGQLWSGFDDCQLELNRSRDAALVQEIKALINGARKVEVQVMKRHKNGASHELAKVGRVEVKTAVWLQSSPEGAVNIFALDRSIEIPQGFKLSPVGPRPPIWRSLHRTPANFGRVSLFLSEGSSIRFFSLRLLRFFCLFFASH